MKIDRITALATSLLQFRRADFGVESAKAPTVFKPTEMAVKRTPCETLYWSDGEFGFVLVAEAPRISPSFRLSAKIDLLPERVITIHYHLRSSAP